MTRRVRLVLWSLGIVAGLVAVLIAGMLTLTQTDWGHDQVRRIIVSRAGKLFNGHGRLYIGRLDGGLGGHFSADSVAVLDEAGRAVFAASRVEADGTLSGLLTANIHLTRLLLVRPYALLERKDSVWNFQRLVEARKPGSTPTRSTLALALDQAELRDGRIDLVTPDSLPSLPTLRREFTRLQLVIGHTRVLHPDTAGGIAPVTRISVESSRPPVSLRNAAGTARWWHDSLALDFPEFRLPGSHASVRGGIAWAVSGPPHIDLLVHADSISLPDVAWITSVIPKHGDGSTDVHVRNAANPHDMAYMLTNLDMRATRSRITGKLTATVGRQVSVTDLALDAQPLDLDLVRELIGDSVPNKVWQGALTGSARGPGGPLTALRLTDVRLAFEDRRAGGAISHALASGELEIRPAMTTLHGFEVRLEDLDVHTLGAVLTTADSLHGVLVGHLVLDGPMPDLRFHDLALTHVDGDRARSQFSGEGRLASDRTTRWLDATFSLDTLAIATLMRGRTSVPLRGTLHGTLELHATRDTLSIGTLLRSGEGTLRFDGASLLDSTRTWLQGLATFQHLDPREVFARKDIPFLRLDGRAGVEIAGDPRRVDGHADITLDTTSVIGDSHLTLAHLRAGVDSTGFHVDTAEVHARDWRVSARGRLARTGVTPDTLLFKVEFDSLSPLHALLLDSAGKALVDSLHGAVAVTGTATGSLDTLAVDADFGVRDARLDGVTVRRATGHAALGRLPAMATGRVTLSADSVAFGGYTASRVQATADLRDGKSGHLTATVASGDTLTTRIVADAFRAGDSTRVSLDSLSLVLGANRWRLERPTQIAITPGLLQIDSTVFRSERGATIGLRATVPDAGASTGALHLEGFGPAEFAFTRLFSPDLEGRLRADVALAGTREAPKFTFSAAFDSVKFSDHALPALAATGTYESRRVHAEARGTSGAREIIRVTGDLPMDLSLKSVPKRLLDDSLTVLIRADSATLAGLEAVIPNVEGLSGSLSADLAVRGTWKQVNGSGTLRVRDGAFTLPKFGTVAQGLTMDDTLSRDSLRIHLRSADGDGPANTMTVDGALWLDGKSWQSNLTSVGRNFRIVDDPELASGVANWLVHLTGPLKSTVVEGDLAVLSGTLVIGRQRAVRTLRSDTLSANLQSSVRNAQISSLRVLLGNDVRLKSRAANVKLAGEVELSGPVKNLTVDGELFADRGTYLVDLGVLKRTFLVDSGTVRLAGRLDIPASIDLWTSYVVRRIDQEDLTIIARLTGTTDAPRLTLGSNDLGSAMAQSEIISYLIFGAPSFASQLSQSTVRTATAALVPSLGGVLEGALGSIFPFFSSLQVSTIAGNGPQSFASPLEGLLNSIALTAGRQVGSESFLNLSGGVCRTGQLSSTQSPPAWGALSLEYRPKYRLSAVTSFQPVSSPCYGLGRYQFGLDLFREWKF